MSLLPGSYLTGMVRNTAKPGLPALSNIAEQRGEKELNKIIYSLLHEALFLVIFFFFPVALSGESNIDGDFPLFPPGVCFIVIWTLDSFSGIQPKDFCLFLGVITLLLVAHSLIPFNDLQMHVNVSNRSVGLS